MNVQQEYVTISVTIQLVVTHVAVTLDTHSHTTAQVGNSILPIMSNV